MAEARGYAAGAFALEVGGQPGGYVVSVEGGEIHADVVTEPPGPDGVARKHVANVGYDEIVVTCGVPEGPLGAWVVEFLTGSAPRRDGAIVFLDYSYRPVRRLEWRDATISSVAFPALDGSGKDTGRIVVSIRPESTRSVPGSGPGKSTSGTKKKLWVTSNFRVDIKGVDCSRVASVGALTVSQPVPVDDVGIVREPRHAAGPLQVGDLVLTVGEAGVSGFTAWRDDFLVKGNNGAAQEKSATVTALGPDLKAELFRLELKGLGIHHLEASRLSTGADTARRQTASMYCEEVALVLPKSATEGSPPPAPADPPAVPPADPGPGEVPGRAPGASEEQTPDPATVAHRLLSVRREAEAGGVPVDPRRLSGTRLGAAWAQREAGLDELTDVSALAKEDWTALTLPEGHSLLRSLQEALVVPAEHEGGLVLDRDAFVSGLVEGAADVYAQVKEHLEAPKG